jgi:hypothetical protein
VSLDGRLVRFWYPDGPWAGDLNVGDWKKAEGVGTTKHHVTVWRDTDE